MNTHQSVLFAVGLSLAACADIPVQNSTRDVSVFRLGAASKELARLPSPEAAVNQRRDPSTSPRILPDVLLAGHTDMVSHAAFSPVGSRITITTSWAFTSLPPASEPYS